MLHARILYALALVGGFFFQVFYTGYFSWYLLLLLLVAPLFSLLLSLPGLLGCTGALGTVRGSVTRGERAEFLLHITSRWHMPISRAVLKLELCNTMTGEKKVLREKCSGISQGRVLREVAEGRHCGVICCRVTAFRVCDLLGLFTLRRPLPQPAEVCVLPQTLPPESVAQYSGQRRAGGVMRPRPGGGPGEDYDLRLYRPGDPMRAVHWKLSSKVGDLVVRETVEPYHAPLVLTFDHFGTPECLDGVLDRLSAVSRGLLAAGQPHFVQWADPETAKVRSCPIQEEGALGACLRLACRGAAPPEGYSVLDAPLRVPGADGPVRHLHLWPEQREGDV